MLVVVMVVDVGGSITRALFYKFNVTKGPSLDQLCRKLSQVSLSLL